MLSSPRGTEMFQFPRFPLPALCVQAGVTPHDGCRVSPFGHPRVNAWSAAHRGLSQPPTSFIGSRRQGIHRWLFVAWNSRRRCSCSLCNSQRSVVVGVPTTGRTASPTGSSRCLPREPGPGEPGRAPSKRNRRRTIHVATCITERPKPAIGQLGRWTADWRSTGCLPVPRRRNANEEQIREAP